MLEELNKKREKICKISQTLTFIIVAITILLVALSSKHFLFGIFGGLILVICLYLLSKLIVMPKYNLIKAELIQNVITKERENIKCSFIESFKNPLDIFFDIINMSYTNPIRIEYKDLNIDVQDFVITENKARKAKILYKGKIIQFEIENFFTKEVLAIPDFLSDSKTFENKAKEHFQNANLELSLTSKGKYLSNTNDKNDLNKIATIFDKVDNFHLILYKNKKVSIMIKEKIEPFECSLQNEIDTKTVENCKKSYAEINKILNYIDKNNPL